MSASTSTIVIERRGGHAVLKMPRFEVVVVEGPDKGARAEADGGRLVVGSAGEGVELKLRDRRVSRHHLELLATDEGIALQDLGSKNGTQIGDLQIGRVVVREAVEIKLGRSRLRMSLLGRHQTVETSEASSFHGLVGSSAIMRAVYAKLSKAASKNVPILITGESGTGKELAARAVHEESPRAAAPFEIVHCGGLTPTLIASQLFGHRKGAFTGADRNYEGAFARADGGTLFLDELGEMPYAFQAQLLRAVGESEIQPLGTTQRQKVNVRIVAATHRNLREAINQHTFRHDLFYRLAVIQVHLPPLRERREDLRELVPALLSSIGQMHGLDGIAPLDGTHLDSLKSHHWPGNIRELRNYLQNYAVLEQLPALPDLSSAEGSEDEEGGVQLFSVAKARFEERYIRRLLTNAQGNVSEAARRAGVHRAQVHRWKRKYGIDDIS